MMGRRIQMRQLTQIIALVALGIFWGASNEALAANESRCNQLGANCNCSEPMNTATWSDVLNATWFNPADTTVSDKQCASSNAIKGGFYETGAGSLNLQVASSGEALTNLPSGHTNNYVVRTNDGIGYGFFAGNFEASMPTARRSVRYYHYWSTNYSFVNEVTGCTNSNKYMEFGASSVAGPMFTVVGGTWSLYGVNTVFNWNRTIDCCVGPGPGNYANGPGTSALKGKWYRIEIITHNAAPTGPGTYFEVFIKNVTDNGPELQILDTSQAANYLLGNWDVNFTTNLHPIANIDFMSINTYRAGTCTGFQAYSHYITAAWSTDAGQRIGAAVEVEGGGGGTNPPPAAPVGLIIQ